MSTNPEPLTDLYELTNDEADILAYALRQVYLFDGYDPDNSDSPAVADLLVKFGEADPREVL